MNLSNPPISVGDDTFTPDEMCDLSVDKNCQRSYMGKNLAEIVTPGTTWHRISKEGKWVGAIMIDEPAEGMACHHICAFEGKLSREEAIIATQMSAKISIIRGLFPFTTVLQEPSYDYMRKFLEDCGFEKHKFDHHNLDTYVVPRIDIIHIEHEQHPNGWWTLPEQTNGEQHG